VSAETKTTQKKKKKKAKAYRPRTHTITPDTNVIYDLRLPDVAMNNDDAAKGLLAERAAHRRRDRRRGASHEPYYQSAGDEEGDKETERRGLQATRQRPQARHAVPNTRGTEGKREAPPTDGAAASVFRRTARKKPPTSRAAAASAVRDDGGGEGYPSLEECLDAVGITNNSIGLGNFTASLGRALVVGPSGYILAQSADIAREPPLFLNLSTIELDIVAAASGSVIVVPDPAPPTPSSSPTPSPQSPSPSIVSAHRSWFFFFLTIWQTHAHFFIYFLSPVAITVADALECQGRHGGRRPAQDVHRCHYRGVVLCRHCGPLPRLDPVQAPRRARLCRNELN
jgi:hypothetical protein